MNAKNRIQLIGNLGNDPEMVKYKTDKEMVTFPLATHEAYLNGKGEKTNDTQWHHIVAFGKLGERIMTHLSKGDEILATGKMTYDSYGIKNGNKTMKGSVFLKEVIFINTDKKVGSSEKTS